MKRVALAAGLILIAATAFSFGSSERVTVHGTIHVTGNDPHTFLILRTDNGDTYRLEGTLADELRRDHQNHAVTVVGVRSGENSGARPATIEVRSYERDSGEEQSEQPQDTEFYGDIRVVGGEEMAPGVPLLITGRLAVVGHGEFSILVVRTRETLHDESLVFEITGPHLEELYPHQNQIAYLEGWIVRVPKGPRAGAMHVTSFRFLEDT